MADARLDELMSDLERAGSDSASSYERGGGVNAYAREIAEARAAIVAHVREREVELMALALHAEYAYGLGRSHKRVAKDWRDEAEDHREYLRETTRALRDAFDQAGGKGA